MAAAVDSSVQDASIKDDSPPQEYILKDALVAPASLPVLDIITVDIELLSSSSAECQEELKKLHAALSSSGYFQAVNHGMSPSFLDEVRAVIRRFFSLPIEEKIKYARTANDMDGYGNDTVYSENQTLDWNDRLYLNVYPESTRRFEKWPKTPENFRDLLIELTEKLRVLDNIILKVMAKSLKLEENCFVDQFGENPIVLSRFNFYPPCPRPESVLAAKAHADASGTTYLLQDKEVEGLQVQIDGQWYRIPVTSDGIVFNVGDQVEIMTNGIYKSPVHRVVTNEKRERMTLAIFFAPDQTVEVKPAEGLIDKKNPRKYKSIVDYTRNCFEAFQKGIRPIDALKI